MAGDLEITNGHAARMRFSRFKQHMEGVPPIPRKPRSSGGSRTKKSKAEKSKREKPEEKGKKAKTEKHVKLDPALQIKPDPAPQIKPDPEQMDVDLEKVEAEVKPEPVFKQEILDHTELGNPFDYAYNTSDNQADPLGQGPIQEPPSMFDMPDTILLDDVWSDHSPPMKQEPMVKVEPGWFD